MAQPAKFYAPHWGRSEKEMEDIRERAVELLKDIQFYLSQPQQLDKDLLALHRKMSASVFARKNVIDDGYTPFENLKVYVGAIAKAEKTVFEAKGYSIDTDFDTVKTELVSEQNRLETLYKELNGAENYQKITEDIIRKKEKLKVNGRTPLQCVEDFASLNYLLGYAFNQIEYGSCVIPMPGTAPKPKPLQVAVNDSERRKRLAIAKAKALQLKLKLLKVA